MEFPYMRGFLRAWPAWSFLLLAAIALCTSGCSRTEYRLEADRDAYNVTSERNGDPRWSAADISIEIDPRSRYFDHYDSDCAPMPQDDPSAHSYMRCVDGMKGWKHWYDNGVRSELENPVWREELAQYVETTEDGGVKLNVDSALRLSYVHSPTHQSQLETLYLSALDVTRERWRLNNQYFGGFDTVFNHRGEKTPAGESNRLTTGRGIGALGVPLAGRFGGGGNTLQMNRSFATAGEMVAGIANAFTWEFTNGNVNFAGSLLSASFVQPLLRGAGRSIALEDLTQVERNLLANLRAYAQFRQGFYTQVAIGELGVRGPQRGGLGTTLTSFSGGSSVGGYTGLLKQLQEKRNSEDTLSLQVRTFARLEAFYAKGMIGLVQVDQFEQDIETAKSALLVRENGLDLALDRYKTRTLGLPPDLPIELDDGLIRQFQLFARQATNILNLVVQLQNRAGALFTDGEAQVVPEVAELELLLTDTTSLIEPIQNLIEQIPVELERMDEVVQLRMEAASEDEISDDDRRRLVQERKDLGADLVDFRRQFGEQSVELTQLKESLSDETRDATARGIVNWLTATLTIVDQLALVQARARLESVMVDTVGLDPVTALEIALQNRLDFMNGRAALVDSWREIQIAANALKSNVTVGLAGSTGTVRNNVVSFDAANSTATMGVQVDAPLTRLLERNGYSETLISYQQDRRALIQSRDSLYLGVRALLRQLKQDRENLEIQRRAVTIAIRRVDQTQRELNAPGRIPQPGQRPFISPTTAINLLSAQRSFLSSQNGLLGAWLSFYATRMRLYRELGIMTLDSDGKWIEFPIAPPPGDEDADAAEESSFPDLPPPIPLGLQVPPEFDDGEQTGTEIVTGSGGQS
jgi:outer membrane protein TolC